MSISSSFPSISPSLNLDFAKSKSLDPRITFTRTQTGNIATYVGSDGLIKYAAPDQPRFEHKATFRTNYARHSEEFDLWIQTRASVSSNSIIAPDGSSAADKIVEDGTLNNSHLVYLNNLNLSTKSSIYVFSVYAKAAERSQLLLRIDDSAPVQRNVLFDLSTGSVVSTSNSTGLIENVGNGWYRCINIMTSANGVLNAVIQLVKNGTLFYDGDGASGLYLWGAQLEASDAPTAYIATGPSAVTRTATESLGLLIEEQRANLFKYSEDYTQPEWFKGRVFITANATTAPDGTQTADLLTENNTSTGEHYLGQIGFNYTSGQSYTWSWYVKPNGRTNVYCKVYTNFNSTQAILNLDTGDVYHATTEQFDNTTYQKLTNGWYRVSFTKTATSTGEGNVLLGFGNSPTTYSYLGDNTSGMYYWGAQVEAGAFPTSYIPTVSGSSVARPVDFCSIAASQMSGWFNSDNFSMTIEAESSGSTPGVGRIIWGISDAGSFNNSIYLTLPETNNTVSLSTVTGGTGQGTIAFDTVFDKNTVYNLGFGVANADRVAVNGGAVTNSISSGTLASEYNQFNIGSGWSLGAARQGRATISKLTYYPKRLTNSQLQILTR